MSWSTPKICSAAFLLATFAGSIAYELNSGHRIRSDSVTATLSSSTQAAVSCASAAFTSADAFDACAKQETAKTPPAPADENPWAWVVAVLGGLSGAAAEMLICLGAGKSDDAQALASVAKNDRHDHGHDHHHDHDHAHPHSAPSPAAP